MSPFQPGGTTYALAVTAASGATNVQLTDIFGANSSAVSVRIYNAGPNDVFINLSTPTATAVAPTPGSPTNSYPLPAGAVEIVSAGPDTYISAVSPAGTATLYATPGYGI